jgi:2-oxoacid:acceptor oxidoreductase gamma subunit (pyruvate/2-ketoisovalerate family)
MIELRFHGRGGQGAVVASKVLAEAAFHTGRYVQSYPDYGVERRGAPVVAFARIAEPGDDLFVRQDIRHPDHLLVLDATLLGTADVLAGLRPGGWVVANSPDAPAAIGVPAEFRAATVDASTIAVKHRLGSLAQPVVNTAILGAFVRATGIVSLEDLLGAIKAGVPIRTEENRAAAREAFERVDLGERSDGD